MENKVIRRTDNRSIGLDYDMRKKGGWALRNIRSRSNEDQALMQQTIKG